jgi:hypothetical protein
MQIEPGRVHGAKIEPRCATAAPPGGVPISNGHKHGHGRRRCASAAPPPPRLGAFGAAFVAVVLPRPRIDRAVSRARRRRVARPGIGSAARSSPTAPRQA